MKESSWAFALVSFGLAIFAILMLTQRISTSTEEDFYLGREVLTASMLDAVDYSTFRNTGELVMIEQKFVEIFIRRFAESVSGTKTYKLDFYDIREYPPKASVRVRTSSGSTTIGSSQFDVTLDTLLSGVLETVIEREEYMDASAGLYWFD